MFKIAITPLWCGLFNFAQIWYIIW